MSTLQQILSKKTDHELIYYIENVDKHTEEAVRLALSELQKRNVSLPEYLSERIEAQLKEKAVNAHEIRQNPWTKNLVKDPNVPAIYSQNAIYIFSILFSVFFGSFMLASNCNDFGKPRWPVILYGLLYTILYIIIGDYLSLPTAYSYIINGVGVLIMYELFWKRYIGSQTKYRSKPIWKPLIIAAVIFIPLIALIIYSTSITQ